MKLISLKRSKPILVNIKIHHSLLKKGFVNELAKRATNERLNWATWENK